MLEHTNITPGGTTDKTKQVPFEDCYFNFRAKFKDLEEQRPDKTDAEATAKFVSKQGSLIHESVTAFAKYNQRLMSQRFCKQLASEFSIPVGDFKEAEKQLKEEEKEREEKDGEPRTARVERFIRTNYDLYYNEVSHRYMGRKKGEPEMYEVKLENIYRELDLNHLKYSWSDLKILLRTDYIDMMNPFESYFENLDAWDGKDHITELTQYISVYQLTPGKNERERFERMFKKMLVRMVACSLEMDFNKHCFTLVHEQQSSGKSTFIRWLCPPELQEYYSENIGISKDDRIALAENFIINIEELAVMGKHDINALKAVISKDTFKERLPYAERTEMLKRRCNFLASTNRTEFLADETGSVRWICFQLEKINWDYKKDIDINKVYAQAYHLLTNTDYEYQLTKEELDENEVANRNFFIRTVEMDLLIKYYARPDEDDVNAAKGKRTNKIRFMSATEIKEDIASRSVIRDHLSNVNLGKALKFLGYDQVSVRTDNESRKGYWMKEAAGEERWGQTPPGELPM